MIQNPPSRMIVPSSGALSRMVDQAMRSFDADREQAAFAADAKAERRMERFMVAEAAAKRWRRLYGPIP